MIANKRKEKVRVPTSKELVYDEMGDQFEERLSLYDTNRRIHVLIEEFLGRERLDGKQVLDVGCGLGYGTERLLKLGANVTAVDIGQNLVTNVGKRYGCKAVVADAMDLLNQFDPNTFDVIFSSECIEHTPYPQQSLAHIAAVLKPGGWISLSTPNLLWSPVVKGASVLGIRKFNGHENFSTFRSLKSGLAQHGVSIVREKGLHLIPFQFHLYRLSTWMDDNAQFLRGLMINLCILGQKSKKD